MKNISIPDELAPYILGILQLYGAQQPAGVCNRIDTAISPEGTFGDDTLEASGDYISFLPSSPQKGGKEETEQEEKDLPPTPPIEKEEIDKEERRGDGECACAPVREAEQVEENSAADVDWNEDDVGMSTFEGALEDEDNDDEEEEGKGASRNPHLPPKKINFSINKKEETASEKREDEDVVDNPPSLDELRTYFNKMGMKNFTPEQFFDYYEARQWMMRGNIKMRNWKACMRTWERKQVYDLTGLKSIADFREFLDKRCPMPEELTKEQETYLEMYAPGNQYLYGSAEMVDYVLREKKMPLRQCLGFVGRVVVERAIMQNLDDLRTFCDVPQWRFSNEHVYNVTQLILNNYSYWKTGELMLALQRLKAGKHGVVDNRLSPTILLARLCTYEKWRLSQVNQRGR